MNPDLLVDDNGWTLHGMCGFCQRRVDNFDVHHRVSAISRGGKGVECVLRMDIQPIEGGPLLESTK